MRYINGIFRIGFVLFFALSVGACHQKDIGEEDAKGFATTLLTGELIRLEKCSRPTAITLPLDNRGTCITNKVSSGLIYDNTTGLPVTTESVPNGTALECHNVANSSVNSYNDWSKSLVEPMPPGYQPVFIQFQPVSKDANGIPTSYLPFTNYSSGDFLICTPAASDGVDYEDYQTVKIQ